MNFKAILEVTEQMLVYANKAEWEALFSLEKTRDILIKNYFSVSVAADNDLANEIHQVLDIDLQITKQALLERDRTGQALKKLGQGKSAVQCYVETS